MSDLISRSEAKKEFRKWLDSQQDYRTINQVLDDVPTAYNVEAVVKEVREIGVGFCDSVECSDGCDDCEQGSLMRAILDAIRKGGVK